MQNRAFEEASYVKSRLRKDLEFWIEERTLDKYIDSLETKVLQRAYRVLNLIGHSNKTFMFLGQNLQPGSMQESSVSSTIIDISTWQGTPFNKSLGALQCLYLGLVRKALPDEEEDLILVHPTLLGYSAKEMETQSTLGELKSFSKQETHRPDREERDTGTFIRPSKPGRAGSSSKHSSRATDFKPISLPPKEPSKSLTWESWILGSERVPGFSAKAEIKGISRKIRHRIGKAKKPASHSQRRQERQYESRTLPSGSVTYGGPQRAIGPDDGSINNPTLHGYYTADDRSEYYEYDPPQIYNEAADQGDDYRFRRSETE